MSLIKLTEEEVKSWPVHNTCTKCGASLKSKQVVYAESLDHLRAGGGYCAKCATGVSDEK